MNNYLHTVATTNIYGIPTSLVCLELHLAHARLSFSIRSAKAFLPRVYSLEKHELSVSNGIERTQRSIR